MIIIYKKHLAHNGMHGKHSGNHSCEHLLLNNANELTHQSYLQFLVVFWGLHIWVRSQSLPAVCLFICLLDLLNMTHTKDPVTLCVVSQDLFSLPGLAPMPYSISLLSKGNGERRKTDIQCAGISVEQPLLPGNPQRA